MAVAIRLMRFGKPGQPSYRIVAIDKRRKRDGSYIEKIGIYQPMNEPYKLEFNEERLQYWTNVGALVSDGVQKLLKSRTPKAAKPAKKEKAEAKAPAKKAAAKKPATKKEAKKA